MTFKSQIDAYRKGKPARKLRAVLFDMDGVLFDSMPNHAASWAKVCTEFGLDMEPEEAYMHEGRTGASTINILLTAIGNATPRPRRLSRYTRRSAVCSTLVLKHPKCLAHCRCCKR